MNNKKIDQQTWAEIALLAITLAWGFTFVTVKSALQDISPFLFTGIRFSIAFLVLCLIFIKKFNRNIINKQFVLVSGSIGFMLFVGYALQTVGLLYTTPAKSGFITGFAVVLTPIIGKIWKYPTPNLYILLGIVSATIGMVFLSINGFRFSFNIGDLFTFFCTIAFSFQIVMVGYYARRFEANLLAIFQIGFVAVFSLLVALFFETLPATINTNVWRALIITAIPATALSFWVQNVAQKYTTATKTAIIFAMEPVFAGLFSWIIYDEVLTGLQIIGCVLILFGMLTNELRRVVINVCGRII